MPMFDRVLLMSKQLINEEKIKRQLGGNRKEINALYAEQEEIVKKLLGVKA